MANKKSELPNTKSTYILKSFDERFTAEEHNTYFKNKSALERKLLVKAIAKGKNKTFLETRNPESTGQTVKII